MKKMLFVLTIIVILSMLLAACGSSGGTVLPGQIDMNRPAVGEKQLEQGINEFFQNDGECAGIIC